MKTKNIKAHIQNRIDTWANWNKADGFTPLEGEIIIYTTNEQGNPDVKIKIGDGKTNVKELGFWTNGNGNVLPDGTQTSQIQSDWAQENKIAVDFIKNKIGDKKNIIKEDLRNYTVELGEPSSQSPFFIWGYVVKNILDLKDIQENLLFRVYQNDVLIDETHLITNAILDSQFTPDGSIGYWGLINAEQSVETILSSGVWERKYSNPTYPTFSVGFIKNNSTDEVQISIGAPQTEDLTNQNFDLQLIFSKTVEQVIGLPDNILSKEFKNVDGILTSNYGKVISETVETKNSYTTIEIENPSFYAMNFPVWENVCTIGNQEITENTVATISFKNVELSTNLITNSMLDQGFGFDPSQFIGYWGIVNSKQTILDIFGGATWEKEDIYKPSFVLIAMKRLLTGVIYIHLVSLEDDLTQYSSIFNINFINTHIEDNVLKLPASAIPTDSQPTENSDNFLTSGTINELLNNFQGGGGVQSDWEQEDETEMDYIKNKPFYELDPVSFEPPRKFLYTWDGEDYADRIYINAGYYKISDDVIPLEDLHDTIVTIQVTNETETQILEMKQCNIWEMVSENGDIGYEIAYKNSSNGLVIEYINIIPTPGTYTSPNGIEQGPYPEAGIYFQGIGSPEMEAEYGVYFALLVKEFKGPIDETQFAENDWYSKDEEDIIYLKQINTEPLSESDWLGANVSYKYYNYIAEYDTMPVEEIYNLTSRIFVPNDLIIVVKNTETINNPWNPEERITLQKGTYVYGDNSIELTSYQLVKKLDKKFVPQDIAYSKIEQGNTKAVSSDAVYRALGNRNQLYFDTTITSGSTNLITSGAVYDALQKLPTGEGGSVKQVQSDWNQEDETAVDYIKNKPIVPTISFIVWEEDD